MIGLFTAQEFAVVETLHAAITGRARFRIKELYRCDSLKDHIERRLGADPAVISASANTLTSAVLLRYDSGATPGRIRSLVEKAVSNSINLTNPISAIAQADRISLITERRKTPFNAIRHQPPSTPPRGWMGGLPGFASGPAARHPASGIRHPISDIRAPLARNRRSGRGGRLGRFGRGRAFE